MSRDWVQICHEILRIVGSDLKCGATLLKHQQEFAEERKAQIRYGWSCCLYLYLFILANKIVSMLLDINICSLSKKR
jgi:hypothetical protein